MRGPSPAARLIINGASPTPIVNGEHRFTGPDSPMIIVLMVESTLDQCTAISKSFMHSRLESANVLNVSQTNSHSTTHTTFPAMSKQAINIVRDCANEVAPLFTKRCPYKCQAPRPRGVEDSMVRDFFVL